LYYRIIITELTIKIITKLICDEYHVFLVRKVTVITVAIPHAINTRQEGKKQMVHISVIEARLSKMGFKASRWFRPEIRELQHILMDNEQIVNCVPGRYFGGFALLVATDHRILLIDKKIPYLSVEDIRYDMISEIDFGTNLYEATVGIFTVNKQHRFNSIKHKDRLRKLTSYAQLRVMELRQYQHQGSSRNFIPEKQEPITNNLRQPLPTPSLSEAYNFGQDLHLEPPPVTQEIRKKMPSPHLPKIMGAAALSGARHWVNPNPYTKGSMVMRKQWSGNG
jgi:hypothetical protein